MKKKLLILITIVLACLFPPSAFAASLAIGCPAFPFNVLCFKEGDISGVIGAAMTFIFIVAVVIALFFLLWGAVRWIFSGGDKAAIEGARGQIVAAIVGLIILFFGFAIFTFLLAFFNVTLTNIEIPKLPKP